MLFIIYFITTVAMLLIITIQNYMAYELDALRKLLGSATFDKLFKPLSAKDGLNLFNKTIFTKYMKLSKSVIW